ncbi:MAG TPA: heavy metal-responsive transcriptional regulator [Actinocrinis sp.]|jgi:DNA-binding transcriptional MerR regulator
MRIGALADESGATTKTIRFYEQAGLLPEPPRTSSGYRDYPPETRTQLEFIRAAQKAGLTLAEIRGILAVRDNGEPPCAHVTTLLEAHLAEVERRMAELKSTRSALRGLLATAAATDPATCTGESCRILA